MDTLTVGNVPVDFPFKPYPCQVVYMEKVIQALQTSTNAILESPTGTGKTLCLLCASLAWRYDFIRQLQQQFTEGGFMGGGASVEENSWESTGINVPKIIYASRTHSQLTQVIQELKNTKYRPRVAIIGSREQLCIHTEVAKKESNSEKVHLCRAKVKSRSCFYYNNTDVKQLKTEDPVMDIEDLVVAGTKQRMCPYYLARELKSQADIIFMPYNYILDIKTRQLHGVDVQGTVVILDEAHNIEKVCEDSASFDLTSHDLAQCIGDVQHILELKKKEQAYSEDGGSNDDDMQDLLNLKEFFLTLEATLDGVQFTNKEKKEIIKSGVFIFEFLEAAGLTRVTCSILMDQCNKAISFLTTDGKASYRNGNAIQKFCDAIRIVFSGSCDPGTGSTHHYKVFIKAEEDTKKNKKSAGWSTLTQEASMKECRTLSYWCFSPGRTMADLVSQGVRSIILTSGTLSPLSSFSSELQINIPIKYEGPHVISNKQVWLGVVSKGSDGIALNSSYANRFSASYQNSLGNTIVNFSRIVPHGLLIFFPSYPVMNGCVETWKGSGIFQRMEQFKPVFQEPRRKFEFNSTMDAFYESVQDSKGATFLAVCRGKVSEGLDFANQNGRAVIITGLPYPPRMDPKVTLKMQYLQETMKRPAAIGISGEEWYKQQASRAVNQAIGRVIRHRHDYGAIILCDERFAYNSSVQQLPQWLRPHLQTYTKFGLVQRDLTAFFKEAIKDFGDLISSKKGTRSVAVEVQESGLIDTHAPIVVRENRYHSNKIQPQNASLVDIHVPGKLPQLPRASLAKLKEESSREAAGKSLLCSLADCEVGGSGGKPVQLATSTQSLSQSILEPGPSLPATATNQPFRPFQTVKPTSKKIVIVTKNESSKMETVAEFMKELKASLSNEAFRNFKILLKAYKETSDVYSLTEGLRDLFKQPSLYHLLKGMHSFVHEKHKKTFELFYNELTGKPLKTTPTDHIPLIKRKLLESDSDGQTCKVRKTNISGDKGQSQQETSSHLACNAQLSTSLLTKNQHLNTSAHLNQRRT